MPAAGEARRFALALTLGVLVCVGVLLVGAALRYGLPPGPSPLRTAIDALAPGAAILAGILTGARLWHGRLSRYDLRLQVPAARWLALAVLAIPFLFALEAAISTWFRASLPDIPVMTTEPPLAPVRDSARLAMAILATGLLHPFLEEVLWRRYVLAALLPYGAALAIVGSAVAFGLLHGLSRQAALATVAAIAYGWLTVRSGSLLPAIVAHAGLNIAALLTYHFAQAD